MQPSSAQKTKPLRAEQVILFRCSNQIFAISSASVQEVRSVDGLAGSPQEIHEPSVPKVRHMFRRGDRNLYVVNSAVHFGLRPTPAALLFLLRKSRTALLINGIEKMTSMTRLQALPAAFCHEEHIWYRGLTVLDQAVVPVVSSSGFLTPEELFQLDTAASRLVAPEFPPGGEMGLSA